MEVFPPDHHHLICFVSGVDLDLLQAPDINRAVLVLGQFQCRPCRRFVTLPMDRSSKEFRLSIVVRFVILVKQNEKKILIQCARVLLEEFDSSAHVL